MRWRDSKAGGADLSREEKIDLAGLLLKRSIEAGKALDSQQLCCSGTRNWPRWPANWESRGEARMRRSDLVQNDSRNSPQRTTQIVFGERQHLLRVLDSLEGSQLPPARRNHERRVLEELIHARTKELNEVNASWDEKVGMVLSAEASPDQLEKLVKQAPKTDFYLLRLISEHPKVSSKTLSRLARHPYGAIRENVARHPNADPATLALAFARSQPAALVSGGVQSQYAFGAATQAAGTPAQARRNRRHKIDSDKQQLRPDIDLRKLASAWNSVATSACT